MAAKSYKDLEVWQRAMDLVVECYRVTQGFPKSEVYGLTNQLQRAAVSIPAILPKGRGGNTILSLFNFFLLHAAH